MVIIVQSKLNLNVKVKNNDIVLAVQNDSKTRFLDVTLLDGTTPINLSGCTVRLYAKKPDNTEIYNNARIKDTARGRVEVEMTNQLLAKVGMVTAQLVISRNTTTILTSLPFKIHVAENLFNTNTVESSNEYGSLVVLYQDLISARQQMQSILNKMGEHTQLNAVPDIDTMFKAFNYIINYLKDNSTAGISENVARIKNNTEMITNPTNGLVAIRNRLDYNLTNTKGDFFGRQVSVLKQTFTKPAGTTTFNQSVYHSSVPAMITFIDFRSKIKASGFFVNASLIINPNASPAITIPAIDNHLNSYQQNKMLPLSGNTMSISIAGTNLPTQEVVFEIEIHHYR